MKAWEKNIRKVVPYVPGEQPKGDRLIKLNTNENPYPPAPGVQKAMREMDYDRFRKYPDPAVTDLVHALAEYYDLGDDQIFVGVGSYELVKDDKGQLTLKITNPAEFWSVSRYLVIQVK